MKLHLPLSLRTSLLALFAAAVTCQTAQAGIMHSDVSLITYTDFGQNTGRYVTTESANALLQHIREQEGGVTITYTGGQQTYVMPHGMIDFGSTYHYATGAAISPSAVATCAHYYTFHSYFNNQVYGIGDEHAIKYKGIEMTEGTVGNGRWTSEVFSHCIGNYTDAASGNGTDHKVMRLSKIITDAPYTEVYDVAGNHKNVSEMSELMYYHAGSGQMWLSSYNTTQVPTQGNPNNAAQLSGAHVYVIGGIVSGGAYIAGTMDTGKNNGYTTTESFAAGGINDSDPLTWASRPGDSGSPLYVWDDGTYKYIGSNRGELYGNVVGSAFVIDTNFDKDVVENRYTKKVDMSSVSTVYLNSVTTQGETVTDSHGYSTTKWLGSVSDGSNTLASFVGVKSELNTWSSLSGLKDTQNWYAYNESYVAQSNQDLFFTENLQFNAKAAENSIILTDTVDLGIGYAEFNGGKFTISSENGESNLFNHAGYLINAGAEVHVQLTNPENYMREWRKIGAGDLYIEGSGNNDALLNVGGSGSTYLNRVGGYAAYNVLVNTGATVIISDIGQIKRDLTFGNRGGTLDMNGNSMDWYTTAETADSDRDGFSVNALTEDATISNRFGNATLTFRESGEKTYVGSFTDTADSSLKIVYDAGGTWVLNSVRTNLQHADSGLNVNNGTVILRGTNTVHGNGSETGRNGNRYVNADDWHYADAAMNVNVAAGGTFELGNHARLTGDVTVQNGGTFIMREGVTHTMEYVEGGQILENTDKYRSFFGLKGDVQLNGGTFAVQFSEGVDSTTVYSGNVTGTGSMTVDAGTDGGFFSFSGSVDAGVSKMLNRGQLILTGAAAADTANKWLVNAGGVMVQFTNAADTLSVIDTASTGVIGLSGDTDTQLDLSSHSGLGIGALSGTTVQYGAAGTTERLTTLNLGGGGRMEVNYALSGSDTLHINAGSMRGGEINLQNVAADYSGTVNVQAIGGEVTLTTGKEGALNNATVNINSGGIYRLTDEQHALGGTVNVNAGGLLQGNDIVLHGKDNVDEAQNYHVELSGNMKYDSLTVENGATLNLREGGRLDAEHAATIAQGGIMRLNVQTLQDKVELKNGGIMYGNGGTIGADATVTATEGTGHLNADGGTFSVNGQIGAAKDATLRLENGTFDIYTGNINTAGGTLELTCSTVNLGHKVNNATQNIGGTLSIANNLTIAVRQGDPNKYQGITHNINHLNISNGSHLSLTESGDDWRHVFNIANITGKGSIAWTTGNRWFNHTAMGASRLILTGDNSFEGIFTVNQEDNHGSMQYLALEHNNAAKNMVILLNGDSNSKPGLAVNTDNAHVVALGGTNGADAYSFVYAGPAKTAGNGNNPVSTKLNTLTLTTSDAYTYHGTLLGDETTGLNIVMDGSGSQSFSNSANVVHAVTALQGTLNFTNAPTIHGDVSIAQGATVQIGSAYSLDAGHALHVLTGAAGGSATLNSSLILNGGELSFGAYNADGSASLSVNGVSLGTSFGSSLALSFSNTAGIQLNREYLLASGDWNAVNGKMTVSDSGYLTTILTAGSNGLSATFSMKDGYTAWEGNNSVLTEGATVVFAKFGGADSVKLSSDTTISTAIFDNADTFTVSSENGSTLNVGSILKSSEGNLVLNTAVSAESMQVSGNGTISGSGSLSVGTLTAETDITTGMSINATEIQGNGHQWTMDGSERSFTQQMSAAQANTFSSLAVESMATLEISANEAATLSTGISGSGTVDKVGSGKLTATGAILVDNFRVSGGEFRAEGTVDIERLSVAGGATATIYNASGADGADKHLGTVELGKGAFFQTYDNAEVTKATSIGSIKLTGDAATLRDRNHSGYYHVGALSMDASVDKATLNIVKNAESSMSTVVELGEAEAADGNFAGTIVLNSDTGGSDDDRRSLFLVLSGQESAAKAVVNLAAADSATAVLGLGVNADDTVIAGLESGSALGTRAKVFSGTVGTQTQWGSTANAPNGVGTTERTLHINTESGAEHNFYGEVMSHLNLIISGSGTQTFTGTSNGFDGSITVNGGTLALGANAESMLTQASSVVVNEGGTLDITSEKTSGVVTVSNVTGTGTLGLKLSTSSYAQTLAVSSDFTGTTYVKQGHFTINGSTFGNTLKLGEGVHFQLNGGSTVTLDKDLVLDGTSEVHQNSDAKLTINGTVTGSGTYERRGGGTLDFNNTVNLGEFKQEVSDVTTNFKGNTTLGVMTLKRSTVSLSYAGEDGNFVNLLDVSCGGTSTGSLRLKENTKLNVSSQLWGCSQSSVVLEKDAALTHGSVQFSNRGTQEAKLETSSDNSLYSVGASDWSLTNGHLSADSDREVTIGTKLVNSSVENAGSGKLTVDNAANSITDVYASAGDMAIMQQAAGLNLDELVVAAGKTVSAYTGTSEIAAAEANVTVHGHAEFGKDAVLNANLTLASGSSLSVAEGGLAMGSTLTLQQGITLDDTTLNRVYSLNRGESVALFTGVDGLKLGKTSYTGISANDEILAAPYFSNLNSDQYRLTYTGTDNGTLSILSAAVPEPTSSMLGLMGLVAFTLRRRRK